MHDIWIIWWWWWWWCVLIYPPIDVYPNISHYDGNDNMYDIWIDKENEASAGLAVEPNSWARPFDANGVAILEAIWRQKSTDSRAVSVVYFSTLMRSGHPDVTWCHCFSGRKNGEGLDPNAQLRKKSGWPIWQPRRREDAQEPWHVQDVSICFEFLKRQWNNLRFQVLYDFIQELIVRSFLDQFQSMRGIDRNRSNEMRWVAYTYIYTI